MPIPTPPADRPRSPRREVTRLAPSPTGALHLGNARTFLVNWALARASGWTIIARIEDLDGPRIKPGAADDCMDTLAWLGIDWDGPVTRQSSDLAPYIAAMSRLAREALAYPCALSRADVERAASAPHAPEPGAPADPPYPPSLRPALVPREFDPGIRHADAEGPRTNWRLVVPDTEVDVVDAFAGRHTYRIDQTVGDFILWTKRAEPAYQLAVVVDDDAAGVTRVVRGDDLLESAARQIILRRALRLTERITYTHLPLVIGPDGRRLAKRHGDTRIDTYRNAGIPPERVIGLIAAWSGVLPRRRPEPMSATEFASAFSLDSMPRRAITLSRDDAAWLEGT